MILAYPGGSQATCSSTGSASPFLYRRCPISRLPVLLLLLPGIGCSSEPAAPRRKRPAFATGHCPSWARAEGGLLANQDSPDPEGPP